MATIKHGRDTLNDYVAIKEVDFNELANLIGYVRNELHTYMDCRGVQTDKWLTEMVTNLEKAEKFCIKTRLSLKRKNHFL